MLQRVLGIANSSREINAHVVGGHSRAANGAAVEAWPVENGGEQWRSYEINQDRVKHYDEAHHDRSNHPH